MDTLIESFREKTLSFLREIQSSLSREYPNVSVGVSCPNGSSMALSVFIADSPRELPDLVELEISIIKPNIGREMIDVDVVWGADGGGSVESSFASAPLEIDEKVLADVYADLPRLVSVLKAALVRGKPRSWE